jgi:hypothetical protein
MTTTKKTLLTAYLLGFARLWGGLFELAQPLVETAQLGLEFSTRRPLI